MSLRPRTGICVHCGHDHGTAAPLPNEAVRKGNDSLRSTTGATSNEAAGPIYRECEKCGLLVACWSDAQIEQVKRDAAMLFGKLKPPRVASDDNETAGQAGQEVCCQDFDSCRRPCTPRWIELGKTIQAAADKFASASPVAWMFTNEEGDDDFGNNYSAMKRKNYKGGAIVPLYSTPLSVSPVEQGELAGKIDGDGILFLIYEDGQQTELSVAEQREIIDALRRPVVPQEATPTGTLDPFDDAEGRN